MNLARTQFLSLATKAVTTALGIVQSIIIVRLLSEAQFGLVGLVMSIGGVIGVSQHLGIVDGAIREIAVRRDRREIGKVFWVSNIVRQLVTIPLSIGLVVLAPVIASSIYSKPEITPFIQLFAAVLVLQGLQDVLGATLTGMKKFVPLYATQIITAAINIAVFGYLTWAYSVTGFFYAVIITTSLMVGLLLYSIAKDLRHNLALPTVADIRTFGRRLMKIGAYMYASRIFFVVWQRLPLLVLGGVLPYDQLGYLNVSLTFGARLTIIAMALSEVNLSLMSALFATQREEFVRVVTRNMHRVLVLMSGLTLGLLFFTPEILTYVIGTNYLPAEPLIYSMTLAFFLYSLTDIGTSSIFVSADNPKIRAGIYGAMMGITAILLGWLLLTTPSALYASVAVLVGAVVAYVAMIYFGARHYHMYLLTRSLALLLVAMGLGVVWLLTEPHVLLRTIVFITLLVYLFREAHRNNLLPRPRVIQQHQAGAARPIICFAGAAYDQPSWTNRQQMMSRVAHTHPVLYVEPRIWIVRYVLKNIRSPQRIAAYLRRIFWYEQRGKQLFVKAQWNVLPLSREVGVISTINHWLNRWNVLLTARVLGFLPPPTIVWIYDTEAAEYLSAFRHAFVLYDCVDDHAAQAGVNRNPRRVEREEQAILARANLVTVTSQRLFEIKRAHNPQTHLVLNAGNVLLYTQPPSTREIAAADSTMQGVSRPIFGSVGALDSYKMDFDLLSSVALSHPDWHFVFIGEPIVDRSSNALAKLRHLPNVHVLGAIEHTKVPAYVQHFDICLIPYRASRYNEASFPLKFWEFMATGKPIIVTGVPELRQYQPLIGFAKNVAEFTQVAEWWLRHPAQDGGGRRAQAMEHSWEKRVEHILRLLTIMQPTGL